MKAETGYLPTSLGGYSSAVREQPALKVWVSTQLVHPIIQKLPSIHPTVSGFPGRRW